MDKLTVNINYEERVEYLRRLYALEGISRVEEDEYSAYCPISLTFTPNELKPLLKKRQDILKSLLIDCGIKVYDPNTNEKYNPDFDNNAGVEEVYKFDSFKILASRYFIGHNISPSNGFGNECEKARIFNRISVILLDKNIRVSRMQPFRTIYLQYENFEKQKDEFAEVFKVLKKYNPGLGFNNDSPVLLGFNKDTNQVVDLEQHIYMMFPNLKYTYKKSTPILDMKVENSELLYELRENG